MADYWPSCFSAFLCRTDIPWVQGFAFSSFLFPWRSRDSEVQGKKKRLGSFIKPCARFISPLVFRDQNLELVQDGDALEVF